MATTTGGTTYVTSTDLVADYPTASLALANRVDVVASGGGTQVKTGGYTITVSDILAGSSILYNSATAGVFTLPSTSLVNGMTVEVAQIGAAPVSLTGGTIVGMTATMGQYQALRLVYVSASATWYSVAESAQSGLSLMTPTSIANSGGSSGLSGGVITFANVTSISLNGIFTSLFDCYRIVMYAYSASGNQSLNARMRLAGTDATTNYNYQLLTGAGTTVAATRSVGQSSMQIGYAGPNESLVSADMWYPATPRGTLAVGSASLNTNGGNLETAATAFNHQQATAYDGITFFPAASNITGVIRIYSYKNA